MNGQHALHNTCHSVVSSMRKEAGPGGAGNTHQVPDPHRHPTRRRGEETMTATPNNTNTRTLLVIRPGDGDPRHGTPNAYVNQVCRCDLCRAGWATYQRELRRRKQEARGVA